jgi:sugar O-acyltransferase (sialic acid O-acetyltransferase NeuD family)
VTRQLILVGAGGFAREAAEAVRALNEVTPHWELLGYVDDDSALHGSRPCGLPVLGPVELVHAYPDAAVVICTGRPDNYASRFRIAHRLDLPTDRYATIVHPTVALSSTSIVGAGSVILGQVVLTAEVVVGRHVAVMPQTVLTHDAWVGDWATLASGVLLGGGARVQEGAYIGSGTTIREGITIGAWAMVGMGSVVTKNVPPARLWYGSPAKDVSTAPVQAPHPF